MASKVVSFFLFYSQMLSAFGLSSISTAEDLELDNLLEGLNKPAVKTIQNEHGDIYDCVDIYKQPAFDHPLLKNHKLRMTPSFSMQETYDKSALPFPQEEGHSVHADLPMIDCPHGTVPIPRTTKDDLIRERSLFKNFPRSFQSIQKGGDYYAAGIQSKVKGSQSYWEVRSDLSINAPYIYSNNQWSGSVVSVEGRDDTIKVGWMVSPGLYGDKKTRMFTLWAANNNQTGCFNLRCRGFVQTNTSIALDLVFKTDNRFSYCPFGLFQDKKYGDWWLVISENFSAVGYWPKDLFAGFEKGADYVEMGGMVYTAGEHNWPDMGSGQKFNDDYIQAASMFQILFANESFVFYIPDNAFLQLQANRCYIARDNFYNPNNKTLGYSFMYTGPGGPANICR